jgi:hypothetical protein
MSYWRFSSLAPPDQHLSRGELAAQGKQLQPSDRVGGDGGKLDPDLVDGPFTGG